MIPDELKRMKPLAGSDRLGANRDSEYLGAEDIDPDTEPVLTIQSIYNGMVTLQRGKENKDVIVFKEDRVPGIRNVRPLIVNATNRKTLRKLFKSVKVDALVGKQIQLYLDHNVRDPSSGDRIDGIRIRPTVPRPQKAEPIICTECGKPVTAMGDYTAENVAHIAMTRHGRVMCADCLSKAKQAAMDKTDTEGKPEQMDNSDKEENA